MKPYIVAGGIVAVLSFDVIASIGSRSFGFSYSRASLGSYFIYLVVGVIAGRMSVSSPMLAAAATAAVVALADASAGWWLSWHLGPGRPSPDFVLTPNRWLVVAVTVSLVAAIIGAAGGLVGRFFQSGAPAS